MRDVTFGDSGIKELDVRNSLLICDQDDLGSGFDFMPGFKISCKIIVNKNWKELNYYQNQAKECGFNITWPVSYTHLTKERSAVCSVRFLNYLYKGWRKCLVDL